MGKIVRYEIDPGNPAPLTENQRQEIADLKARAEHEIDTSDIPELPDAFWTSAVQNPYFRPVKQQLTLRLDADLVAWFKKHSPGGRGYQSNINRALREYVIEKEKKAG
jgi:uncharacterized protein (DUF4415 family)